MMSGRMNRFLPKPEPAEQTHVALSCSAAWKPMASTAARPYSSQGGIPNGDGSSARGSDPGVGVGTDTDWRGPSFVSLAAIN
jgi:hypothetical protein